MLERAFHITRLGFGAATYATLQWTAVHIIPIELANCHGSIFMGVHFDESEPAVCLKTSLHDEPEILEQGNEVVLSGVGREVPYVTSCLPLRGLLDNHVVALNAVRGEMVVPKWGRWCHAHGSHSLLLGDRRLTFLIGPVTANGTGSQPLAVHGAQGLFRIRTLTEGNEAVSSRTAGFHIPHDSSLRD